MYEKVTGGWCVYELPKCHGYIVRARRALMLLTHSALDHIINSGLCTTRKRKFSAKNEPAFVIVESCDGIILCWNFLQILKLATHRKIEDP